MKLQAKWTDDCSGKKDYDGRILSISTRYWPRGGGFYLHGGGRVWEGNETRPEIRPSANCSLTIWHGEHDSHDIAEKNFEGETFEDVAAEVEAWAQATMDRAVKALRAEFADTLETP